MARQDDWVRLQVRLPKQLHEHISARAASSLNAEIVKRLQDSTVLDTYAEADRSADPDPRADQVRQAIDTLVRYGAGQTEASRDVIHQLMRAWARMEVDQMIARGELGPIDPAVYERNVREFDEAEAIERHQDSTAAKKAKP